MISGTFYKKDIRQALQMFGVMNAREIKAKLLLRNIQLDEAQVLDAVELLIRESSVRRSDRAGYFVFVKS